MNTILIGIAGGSGSGKTTLADSLVNYFGEDEVSILRHDNYYKRHDEMTYEERSHLNYDHPDAFDTDLLCYHIFLPNRASFFSISPILCLTHEVLCPGSEGVLKT